MKVGQVQERPFSGELAHLKYQFVKLTTENTNGTDFVLIENEYLETKEIHSFEDD